MQKMNQLNLGCSDIFAGNSVISLVYISQSATRSKREGGLVAMQTGTGKG
jgi:hypothetical protein